MEIQLRDEQAGDEAPIHGLTDLAFRPMPYRNGREQHIVDGLRAAGALAVSLVAMVDARLVGHVAFSAVSGGELDGKWYALGPVSVHPEVQRRGIGSALIREGLFRLKALHAAGCVLAGNPDYYGRFGFVRDRAFILEDIPPEASLALRFAPGTSRGVVHFHPAFSHS